MGDIKENDLVKFLDFEFKGKEGTVVSVFEKNVIVVKLDEFPHPVATMRSNLKKVNAILN